MKTLCGTDCCDKCSHQGKCGGCQNVKGHAFGGNCIVAECIENDGWNVFLLIWNTHSQMGTLLEK